MELTVVGKIISVGEIRGGISKTTNKSWSSIEYIVEETAERFPKKVCFTVFGDEKVQATTTKLKIGDVITANLDVNCNEYMGRWFNQIQAWKIVKDNVDVYSGNVVSSQAPTVNQPQPQAVPQTQTQNSEPVNFGETGEIPF